MVHTVFSGLLVAIYLDGMSIFLKILQKHKHKIAFEHTWSVNSRLRKVDLCDSSFENFRVQNFTATAINSKKN